MPNSNGNNRGGVPAQQEKEAYTVVEVKVRHLLLRAGHPYYVVPLTDLLIWDGPDFTNDAAASLRSCKMVAGQAALDGVAAPLEVAA